MQKIEENLALVRNELDTGSKIKLDIVQAQAVIKAFSRYDSLDQTVHWFTASSDTVVCKSDESQDWNEALEDLYRKVASQLSGGNCGTRTRV